MVHTLITAVTKRDIDVLFFSVPKLIEYINPKEILVVTPDQDYQIVLEKMKIFPNIVVQKDSFYISNDESLLIKNILLNRGQIDTYGWYVQQFIKIKAAAFVDTNLPILIWDSDTVPLRPINFVKNEKFQFFVSNEFHKPYFETLTSIFDLRKLTTYSFIAQCLVTNRSYAHQFITDLGGFSFWIAKIMNNLSINSRYAFSEYESLGNYMLNKCVDHEFILSKWERDGKSFFYKFSSLEKTSKALEYENAFVAFENITDSYTSYSIKKYLRFLINIFKKIKEAIRI